MTDQPNETPAILFREEGRAGFITLNRPEKLNALTHDMIKSLGPQYIKWGAPGRIYGIVLEAAPCGVFCSGGDVLAITEAAKADPVAAADYFRDEYQQDWILECFSKPHVALIDGLVMGGGVGISIYGTHRVAGENYSLAMPEVGIGIIPDVGTSYVLARLPGEMGVYLGLTGRSIKRADAYYLELVSHCVDAGDFNKVRHAMIEGDPIDPVLDDLHRAPGESELAGLQPVIDRLFAGSTVEDILANLDAEQGEHAAWAQETAATIRHNASLSLKITLRHIREARKFRSVKEALMVDFRIASRMIAEPDFHEGVRATLIDKDNVPQWQPQTLAEVSDAMVDAHFAPLTSEKELELTDHWTLIV